MEYIQKYFSSFWEMTVLMHGLILFGLIVAGIMREFISDAYIKRNLGGKGLLPAIKASVLGLPLPLCSCSVIPLAASLKKSGAGRGAVASFFISTPMTGADSIIATYGVFGWIIAVFRVVSAGVTAIIAGVFIDKLTNDEEDNSIPIGSSCSSGCCGGKQEVKVVTLKSRVKNIAYYTYDLLDDLAFPLLSGFLMAALITLFITPELAKMGGVTTGYALAFVAGIPLYVCSISAIPIALSLMLAGFSPGAAFIFLAAAPATNIVTLNVFGKLMGRRGVLIYVISIVSVTLLTAIIVDGLYMDSGLSFTQFSNEEDGVTGINMVTAGIFLVVITVLSIRSKFMKS